MGIFGNLMGGLFGGGSVEIPQGAMLVDVRSVGEFIGGHLEGSINLPLDQIANRLHEVCPDKTVPIVLFCASGMRSGSALGYMKNQGYQNVVNGGGISTVAMQLNKSILRS